jgi:hypothetical protein
VRADECFRLRKAHAESYADDIRMEVSLPLLSLRGELRSLDLCSFFGSPLVFGSAGEFKPPRRLRLHLLRYGIFSAPRFILAARCLIGFCPRAGFS